MPEVSVELPPSYRGTLGTLQPWGEEEATVWLWAYPTLLGWPRPVIWLYAPVIGKRRWPGDSWGIDSAGNLLIVETKMCKASADPFEDFLAFHRPDREELTAVHWRHKFQHHLLPELRQDHILANRREKAGIVPRSCDRRALRLWPQLAGIIDAAIRSPGYNLSANSALDARAAAGNPEPFYFALMVKSKPSGRVLSNQGLHSCLSLRGVMGDEHVTVLAISCIVTSSGSAQIVTTNHGGAET